LDTPAPCGAGEEIAMGFWQKLKKLYMGDVFGSAISEADEAFFEDLEEMLILADVGMTTAAEAVEKLRKRMIEDKIAGQEPVKAALREILAEALTMEGQELDLSTRPSVVLVIGVNGVGKTTSIGKLAARLRKRGKRVLLCAGDTFRAAAADQLEIWAGRAGCEIVRQHEGADPGAVLFDALQAAKARNVDVVICDTAGRLHNKANLMAELAKLRKIIDREAPEAALETLLVLDATTGQNGLIQAKQFKETAGCTGIVLTKLDGTAKGGIVIAIAQELGVPVKFVGLGEGIDDLQPFDAKEYVNAII
jgi:fused signal recognition particle receptor